MPYRSAEPGSRSTATWGPIPPRFLRIGFGALCLVIAFPLFIGAGTDRTLHCERRSGDATCTLSHTAPLFGGSSATFPASAIAEVRVGARTTKGGTEYDLKFLDARGAEHFLETFGDRSEADAERHEIERFLSSSERELVVESHPEPIGIVMVAAFAIAGLACIVNAFWATGRFRFVLDRGKNELSIRRSFLGIPLGRMDLHASDIEEVRVEYGTVPDWAKTKYQAPETGGRLELRAKHGRIPLSPRFLRGTGVHERGARDLRALLDLPAREAHVPAPAPPRARSKILPIVLLVLGLFAGTFVANLILNDVAMTTQGRLELSAEHRCRFQGMELLPGGAMSTTLDPGRYVIEIWQPNDEWLPEEFVIVQGQTTTLVCRAR